jgi:hypothetical protein
MLCIAFKGTIDTCSFKPGCLGDVGDVVETNGGADGMAYFVDVRGLKSAINAIGNFAAARLRADRRSGKPLGHSPSKRKGRHSCRPKLLEKRELRRSQYGATGLP